MQRQTIAAVGSRYFEEEYYGLYALFEAMVNLAHRDIQRVKILGDRATYTERKNAQQAKEFLAYCRYLFAE